MILGALMWLALAANVAGICINGYNLRRLRRELAETNRLNAFLRSLIQEQYTHATIQALDPAGWDALPATSQGGPVGPGQRD